MKKKSIIAICAVLVILVLAAVLVLTGNRGNISNVNRVVGYSALYGENSINEAFDVIEKKFAKDFEGCTLTELRYDKDVENRFAEEIEKYHKENNQLGVLITYQRILLHPRLKFYFRTFCLCNTFPVLIRIRLFI